MYTVTCPNSQLTKADNTSVRHLTLSVTGHALHVSACDNVIAHHLVHPGVTFDAFHPHTCTHTNTAVKK